MVASTSPQRSRTGRRKDQIKDLLLERDLKALKQWITDGRAVLRTLSSMLFDENPLVVWRTIEAMGIASRIKSKDDMEKVVKLVRRLLWLMNDESGGLCRRGPEAIAEILIAVPELRAEFIPMIPPFLVEEPFEIGTRFAMYRLASQCPIECAVFAEYIEELQASAVNHDPVWRGYSIMALKAIKDNIDSSIEIPSYRDASIPIYDFENGNLEHVKISAVG